MIRQALPLPLPLPLHSLCEEGLCFSLLILGTSLNIHTCPTCPASDLPFLIQSPAAPPTTAHYRALKGPKTQAHCSLRSPFLSILDLMDQYPYQTSG